MKMNSTCDTYDRENISGKLGIQFEIKKEIESFNFLNIIRGQFEERKIKSVFLSKVQ